jgi:hypothetical protein
MYMYGRLNDPTSLDEGAYHALRVFITARHPATPRVATESAAYKFVSGFLAVFLAAAPRGA